MSAVFYDKNGRLRGFEDVANRATAEEVLKQWQESVLKRSRDWLKEISEKGYYNE